VFLRAPQQLLRPINCPPGTPGRGRAFSRPPNGAVRLVHQRHGADLHCRSSPVPSVGGQEIEACGLSARPMRSLIISHAEATSDNMLWAIFRRRARELLVGTHTLPPLRTSACAGAARPLFPDIVMCGDYVIVLAWTRRAAHRFLIRSPRRFEAVMGPRASRSWRWTHRRCTGRARRHNRIAAPVVFWHLRPLFGSRVEKERKHGFREDANSSSTCWRSDTRSPRKRRPWAAGRRSQ